MTGKRFRRSAASVICTFSLLATTAWSASREKVLHAFGAYKKDGYSLFAGVTLDSVGNLYGTTSLGGANDVGAVYELMPKVGGGWTEKLLHSFSNNGTDGYYPTASLVFDAGGNLYGTTSGGGRETKSCPAGCGTVFELVPQVGGSWKEKVLHSFNAADGLQPRSNVILDSAGNLYGTTSGGGHHGVGTVFEMIAVAGGGWKEKVLHSFSPFSGYGDQYPWAGLTLDGSGNLYGTTTGNLDAAPGAVFELIPKAGGYWYYKVLYSFNSQDKANGESPYGSVILDAAGNLYGTTESGGANDDGEVFELTPSDGGTWSLAVIHSFDYNGKDGVWPESGLTFDGAGNLYGATTGGGTHYDGTVFELTPAGGGTWTEQVLRSFDGTDGTVPLSTLIFDGEGNLDGTNEGGGAHGNYGTVFEIMPALAH